MRPTAGKVGSNHLQEGLPVVFSMGDPHGIGPEVLLKALHSSLGQRRIRPVIFGAPQYLHQLRRDLALSSELDHLEMVSVSDYDYPPEWGRVAAQAGRFALDCLKAAVAHCQEENLPLLVTAPVNKKALHLAGSSMTGQTELVASFFPEAEPVMAFFSDRFHLLLLTTHIPLREVPESLSSQELVRKTEVFIEALRAVGIDSPSVAVCGLNPHASEDGLFGGEEEQVLKPALDTLAQKYCARIVSGPFPPDAVFRRAASGEFHGVVALYHDQGLIPLKLLAFDTAVNVTLGLPLTRTSPDHGTAFEIAGQGVADPGSMVAALDWGLRLSEGQADT